MLPSGCAACDHFFAALLPCQSTPCAAYVEELRKREKELGIEPDPEVDALLKAEAVEGKRSNIVTDLMLRVLGLEVWGACMTSAALI